MSPIDYLEVTKLFEIAAEQNRNFLYEHEVYSLLALTGAETPPQFLFVPFKAKLTDTFLSALTGKRVVLKIVSPSIIHKTEVGGVQIIDNESSKIRSGIRRMLYEVPEQYALWSVMHPEQVPEQYRFLRGEALETAVRKDMAGVLLVQYMEPDSKAFGNELIVGLRHTREFGTIISAGLGGTDTELYAKRFRKGQAIVASSTVLVDGQSFFELFRNTIAYRKLAGLTRGQRRIVTDEQLIECFSSLIDVGNNFSSLNPQAPYIIDELEINPFAFTDYLMVPLDGLCRFSKPQKCFNLRPIEKIRYLLQPDTIGIMGVSATRNNFGRIILENIKTEGFSSDAITIVKKNETHIDGIRCLPDISSFEKPVDLLILAIGAEVLPEIIEQIIDQKAAKTVMLIAGSFGETEESRDRADKVIKKINLSHAVPDGGPLFIGANCMGIVSRPGKYDTWFIPREKFPPQTETKIQRAALISQSGAFMLHRSNQSPELNPAYMISMGNQTDLTLGDMVQHFKNAADVDVIAVYAEGFNDLDGLEFCKAVQEAVCSGKDVIFYKAGRTPEGKAATSSHTASLAGDYMVCESCVRQAGGIVARTFTEFQDLFSLAERLNTCKVNGNRLAAVSGAGFEAVGMADSLTSDDFDMEMASFSEPTKDKILALLQTKRLDHLVTINNPLDINPAADDELHGDIADILLQDNQVDALVLSLDPLSPAMQTLDEPENQSFDMEATGSIKNRLITLCGQTEKPVITVVDGGSLYEPLRQSLINANIPVFEVCDHAVTALSLYIQGRLAAEKIRVANALAWE